MKYLGLVLATLLRKPVRSFLTVASIFVAFLLFGMLQSVSVSFSEGPDFIGVDRLVVAPKYSIIDVMPLGYAERLKQVRGVTKVAWQMWFGGTYKDPGNFFPRWAVPPKEYLDVYPEYELPFAQKQAFIDTRTGAIIGKSLADKYGLEVGDKITLIPDIWQNKDGKPWVFDLVGIFDTDDDSVESQMFMNFDYFDEYRTAANGTVGNFVVKIDDPDRAAEIAGEIDAMFANSADETKTATEKAYNQMFAKQVGDIGFIMTSILSAVFFTILLLTGNTMSQAIRERIPELAILKTIGFGGPSILMLVIAEASFIALLGALPGIALAGAALPALGAQSPFLGGAVMTPKVVVEGIALAVLLGMATGAPPAVRAMRLNIVDALGERH